MKKRLRIYLMGYDPPTFRMAAVTEQQIGKIMNDCDLCFTKTNGDGVAIGEVVTASINYGDGSEDAADGVGMGTSWRCISHEYGGKVLIVEQCGPGAS